MTRRTVTNWIASVILGAMVGTAIMWGTFLVTKKLHAAPSTPTQTITPLKINSTPDKAPEKEVKKPSNIEEAKEAILDMLKYFAPGEYKVSFDVGPNGIRGLIILPKETEEEDIEPYEPPPGFDPEKERQ